MFPTIFPTRLIVLAILPLVLVPVSSCPAETPPSAVAPELRDKAISVLQVAMKESKGFERVHAAEALIWTGQQAARRANRRRLRAAQDGSAR